MTLLCGHSKIRIHLLLPFLWGFSILMGNGGNLLSAILAILLHESGHIILSRLLKIKILEIEITPHGGLISLEHLDAAPEKKVFLIAAAGPFFSLLGCIAACYFYATHPINFSFSQSFFQNNLLLLIINLLPALPLDGGRMLHVILSRYISRQRAARWLIRSGYGTGGIFICISIILALRGDIILSPAFAGVYLIYSSAKEEENAAVHYINSLIARRNKLDRMEILQVDYIAASEQMPVHALIGKMRSGKYHVVFTLSQDGMKHTGILYENDICNCILSGNSSITLADCIHKKSGGPA